MTDKILSNIKKHIPQALVTAADKNISVPGALTELLSLPEATLFDAFGVLFEYKVIHSIDDAPPQPAFDIISYREMLRMGGGLFHREDLPPLAVGR